ncbi:PRC-barrel domain-containing protein [Longimicrobium sp.]|uniref:PRC-barrel domain-containing protein n=1 Tax=Longimicrobium sp. TaxID=2029185 RepID=UPI002E31F572|nr:PRC-barrel domain-containing protein [Longimicrobium sp.]HEX6037139.1 PRC-barrel domain-containing protein [Longimicrobium sp.]
MANNDMDRVVPLGQLDDFKVAEGDPDVRGWEVLAADGRKIGEVDELLIDTSAMKVRYLDVDVDGGVMGDGMDRHVLIPIGYARLEQERDRVLVDGLSSSDLGALPSYNQGPLTRDFESSVRDSFRTRSTSTGAMGGVGMMGGAGMMDTAGLDNTPGAGTGLGMTGTTGAGLTGTGTRDEVRAVNEGIPDGEGMRAAGYDMDRTTHLGGAGMADTGSLGAGATRPDAGLRDTGSMRTGTDSDLGVRAGGTMHGGGMVAPTEGSTENRGMSAGSSSHGTGTHGSSVSGHDHNSPREGVLGGSGNAPMSAGGQGPVSGMGTGLEPHGDVSHQSSGLAGSDYQHNADEDFYASDAFDDRAFYGGRRSGSGLGGDVAGGRIGGGMGTGGGTGGPDSLSRGGLSGGTEAGMQGSSRGGDIPGGRGSMTGGDGSASREEVDRLSRDASELLREDHRNRGVGGQGNL